MLLETAATVQRGDVSPGWTFLVGVEGGIRMMAGNDWPLDRLQETSGAEMVYRIRHHAGNVNVEGRAGNQVCTLYSEGPVSIARRLLRDRRDYLLTA